MSFESMWLATRIISAFIERMSPRQLRDVAGDLRSMDAERPSGRKLLDDLAANMEEIAEGRG